MSGGPAPAGTGEARKGGKAAAGSGEPAVVSPGIDPTALTEPRDTIAGVLRDLDSWNPKRHDFNPALWRACADRTRQALRHLDQIIAAAVGEAPKVDG